MTLTTLSHPAVVSFFHDRGVDLRDRSIWNVGPEWAERVISTDPLAVRVSAALEEETLSLYLGRDCTVVHADRADGDDDAAAAPPVDAAEDGRDDAGESGKETAADADSGPDPGSATA